MSEVKHEVLLDDSHQTVLVGHSVDNSTDEVWDEARLEASLEQLQEMYRQLRELRSTLPKLVAPFTVRQASPEIMYRKMAKSIATANQEVRTFRQLLEDETSKKIFEHAKESRAQNPKGIKPFKITDCPDWYEKRA